MTYALLSVPFMLITAAVVTFTAIPSRHRRSFPRRMAASAIAAVVLCVLTAVFDNAIIAAGLVSYPVGASSGLRIGIAPVEDFTYALCAAFLLPALWTLLSKENAS